MGIMTTATRPPQTAPPPGGTDPLGPEPSERRERQLLAAAARGDQSAAGLLVEGTYRGVYSALVRMSGDPELAADLTQETYRKAWSSLAEFRGGSRFATWLYRIAYTTWLNHLRRPRRLTPLTDDVERTADDPAPGPEATVAATAEAQRLRHAVRSLPEDLAWTVTARYWGEVPVSEIARQEGITGAAVRKRLAKARELLAAEMSDARPGGTQEVNR
jgi:RNA polymerase sigma-70 factor (ECF subfamily)